MNMNFDDNRAPGNAAFSSNRLTNGPPAKHDIDVLGRLPDNEKVESSVFGDVFGDMSVGPTDVLCGRSKQSFNHVGNRRFRDLVASAVDIYNNASTRLDKAAVVNSVVEEVHQSGGRFLRHGDEKGTWRVLGYSQCREKVGHAIRDCTSSIEARKKRKLHQEVARRKVTSAIIAKSKHLLPNPTSKSGKLGKMDCFDETNSNPLKYSIASIAKQFADGSSGCSSSYLEVEKDKSLALPLDGPIAEQSLSMDRMNQDLISSEPFKRSEPLDSALTWTSNIPGLDMVPVASPGGDGPAKVTVDHDDQDFLALIDEVLGPLHQNVGEANHILQSYNDENTNIKVLGV
ncbi:expressed unknown protein [Seminavis robusta]|uniref:DUF6824 domain-containing protein n=1 Tax=Seminavis robusta TaxID=568900 RepID=A0A9N8F0I5_9STRA|nr:expressed unknown protein [Seminavis robusta]|eukprot:Sro2367_g325080.1 n/a (344) ;mRNA; r:8702-10035